MARRKTKSEWVKGYGSIYAKYLPNVTFTVDYDDEQRMWFCRRNGKVFDSAKTLREAKAYCVEPEGKPLIDIL